MRRNKRVNFTFFFKSSKTAHHISYAVEKNVVHFFFSNGYFLEKLLKNCFSIENRLSRPSIHSKFGLSKSRLETNLMIIVCKV